MENEEDKQCDYCERFFDRMHSRVIMSGYGNSTSFQVCTDCKDEVKKKIMKIFDVGGSE